MVTYAISSWIIWFVIFFIFTLLGFLVWLLTRYIKRYTNDRIIIIDKNNRWSEHFTKIKGQIQEKIKNKSYILSEDCGLLNRRGKALYFFAENKPQPLDLKYSKAEWLDSESLMAVINNKLVQQIIKPVDTFKDTLMLFGAIGGLIAGLSSIIILLNQMGFIKF